MNIILYSRVYCVIFLELFCLIYDKYLACDLVLIGSYQLGPVQSLDITF